MMCNVDRWCGVVSVVSANVKTRLGMGGEL